ncbi:MAG: ribosomal protein L7/L12 [Abitibacteriaceae bacterium]|nr:ribosomal protein L7/L12 [Abditibacteriaceae bacterium]MBV9864830.1 ribosomal protein L7/L12 [Abditibacteriaceae bacterium]
MGATLLIPIAAFIFLLVVWRFTTAGARSASSRTPSLDGMSVEELVRSGQKIQAIKLYREQTGVGLKEAKDAIDAMAAGAFSAPPVARSSQFMPSPSSTLENLIKSGRKIEAIKLYRQQTGAGLKESKDHVEAIERQLTGR